MSSPQEQFAESLRTGQEAAMQAVQSWTKSAESAFGSSPEAPGQFDPNEVIDQVFNFAEQMLEAQREYAKTLAATAASVAEAARKETGPVVEAARKQAANAAGGAQGQPEATASRKAAKTAKSTAAGPRGRSRARKS
jgi:hypothetical protein